MLTTLIQDHRLADIVDMGIASDNATTLQDIIKQALVKADVLVTSGGVSMGELDLLKPFLMENGKVHFGRLLMKPGKPCTFATLNLAPPGSPPQKKLVFALPGNPVSSSVCFSLFCVPALKKMAGYPNPLWPLLQVRLKNKLKLDPERPEYHRATIEFDTKKCLVASSTGIQASSRLASMKSANGLLVLPQKEGVLEEDTPVDAYLIGSLTGQQ